MSTSGYAFRPMHEADLEMVMQIEASLHSHPWTFGNFRDSLRARHTALLMTCNDEIVAYGVMMIVLDEAELLNISVAAPHQKQGLGHQFLSQLVDSAISFKVKNMYLEVRAGNVAAIALYEKMGFTKTNVRRGYYPAKEGREDAILMGLVL